MDDKTIIKIMLSEYSKNISDLYYTIVWLTIGVLIAAIGWILTSKEARNYLAENVKAKYFVILTILLTELFQLKCLFDINSKIGNVFDGLFNEKKLTATEYCTQALMTAPLLWDWESVLIITVLLSLILIILIILLKNKKNSSV